MNKQVIYAFTTAILIIILSISLICFFASAYGFNKRFFQIDKNIRDIATKELYATLISLAILLFTSFVLIVINTIYE